ncbi:MAG TPA: aminotransferase class III-fold pyridoxal phosphate-dependent enzyme [Acidimicrobiia bacterium]|nr:aminotransferase class III-fold pyridoxal phosphate-dependent enzyme [Acidimicrobiia bacterium]
MSHVSGVWFSVTDLEVVSGAGCVVTTSDGTEYLDFTSGIAVTSTGHCHPRVVAAIREQAGRFIHAQVNCYRHPLLEQLASTLAELTPAGIDSFFFANSGAEATEAAVKLARWATGRPNIVVMDGSFHGRTMLTMAMTTSKTGYRAGYQPLPAGIFVTPFPRAFEWGVDEADAVDQALAGLRKLLATQTAPAETAAVVMEPVLGEGGYLPAPVEYVRGVRELCDEHGILFVADEVQTGFGRTGSMFAIDHSGVRPDIVVMAKGIASGFPIAGIGASAALMERWPVGAHGGTYGGNPIGCAAALATIAVIRDEGLVGNAAARGAQLMDGLAKLQADHPGLGDVRGLGLMVGCELVDDRGRPDAARTAAILAHARDEHRVLFMSCGTNGNIVRWMPPLVVSADEIDRGLAAFASALAATS